MLPLSSQAEDGVESPLLEAMVIAAAGPAEAFSPCVDTVLGTGVQAGTAVWDESSALSCRRDSHEDHPSRTFLVYVCVCVEVGFSSNYEPWSLDTAQLHDLAGPQDPPS